MKLVFALALLIASVAVFSGTAQAKPVDSDLAQLELLLNLDHGEYSLDELVSKIREGLQRVLDQVKEKLGVNQEKFRARIEEIQQKIRDLVKQGATHLEAVVRQIREKLQALIKDVFGKDNKESLYAAEDDDDEDDSLLTRTAQLIRGVVEKVLVTLKKKLAERKELFGEFKERLDEVTAELVELGKKTGRKALDSARALRDKISELNKAILKRIKDKISGSLYTDADKEKDESIQQLIEKTLRQIVERVRAVVQRVLETLKEKLGESKELVEKFGERIEVIKVGLAELGKKSAQQALQAVAELRRKVMTLARDIKKVIKGEEFLYEAAIYDNEAYDEDMIDRIKKQVAQLVKDVIERVKVSLGTKADAPILERIAQLETAIRNPIDQVDEETLKFNTKTQLDTNGVIEEVEGLERKEKAFFNKKLVGSEAFKVIRIVRKDLSTLVEAARKVLNEVGTTTNGGSFYASYDLRAALITIRDIVTQPAGLQKLKAYLNNLQTSHPTVALVRGYIENSSDEELIKILKEFFSGFDGINLADFPVTDLAELFRSVRDEILTDAGIQKLKDYARNIETSHPVVSKIKTAIENRPKEAIRAFLKELFSGLDF